MNEPTILLADEPTGNLDSKTSRTVMDLFHSLNGRGMTIVMVTHSEECSRFARRVMRVSDGKLVGEDRTIKEVSRPPEGGVWQETDEPKRAASL